MKKRILSMLLLVAMIVTALPLTVLPALAAEKSAPAAPVYNEDDYNALYVNDGLILAFDVMALNEYWGEAVNARAEYPTSPMETEAFDTIDERFDFDTPYYVIEQIAANGTVTHLKGSANNYHHFTTREAADAVAKSTAGVTAKNDDGSYGPTDGVRYRAAGPYRATLILANKNANGEYYNWNDCLYSTNNAVGYETKEAAIAAVQEMTGLTEPNEDGAYQKDAGYYFVVGMSQSAPPIRPQVFSTIRTLMPGSRPTIGYRTRAFSRRARMLPLTGAFSIPAVTA